MDNIKKGVILCVDDEVMILSSLRDQLFKVFGRNHIIEVAESAEEGLEILNELKEEEEYIPLIIISDWLMPGMKGDEFLIEAHKYFPHVIKVMLSGQADNDAINRAREHAALYEFIKKPWDSKNLIYCIENGLKEFHKRIGDDE